MTFEKHDESTKVTVLIEFATEADKKKIVEMGFEQGFTMGLDQLDGVLVKE